MALRYHFIDGDTGFVNAEVYIIVPFCKCHELPGQHHETGTVQITEMNFASNKNMPVLSEHLKSYAD
jgi:hypothetical protein